MTDYKAMQEAVKLADEGLVIFNRAIESLRQEKEAAPENQEAEIDWQRVIDEGYLCGFSSISQEDAQMKANTGVGLSELNSSQHPKYQAFERAIDASFWEHCAIRKVPNEIQPHFGGMTDGIEGEHVTIYFRDGGIATRQSCNPVETWAYGCDAEFDDVVAFVIHRPIITEMMRPSSYISQSQGVEDE